MKFIRKSGAWIGWILIMIGSLTLLCSMPEEALQAAPRWARWVVVWGWLLGSVLQLVSDLSRDAEERWLRSLR